MKKYELAQLQHKAHNWDTAVKWIFFTNNNPACDDSVWVA